MKDTSEKHGAGAGDRQAVALHYDQKTAPRVTAKGEGWVADEIIRIAEDNDVHIHEDASLARFLAQVDLGMEIPRDLYVAVAEVIAFAYVLKGKFPTGKNAADYAPEAPASD